MELVRQRAPGLMIDGEMQADTAVAPEIIEETYPFSTLKGGANVLIFPNLEAGNIAYKLLQRIGGAELIGPMLMGLSQARARAAARRGGERHRQHGRHRRGGRAGSRQALWHADRGCTNGGLTWTLSKMRAAPGDRRDWHGFRRPCGTHASPVCHRVHCHRVHGHTAPIFIPHE